MATQPTALRPRNQRSLPTLLGLAIVLTLAIIGGLLLRLPAAPATVPAAPVLIPATSGNRPVANRSFADEIGGAGAVDLTGAASAAQPEWAQAQPLPVAPVVVAPPSPITVANRFFADELAAGVGLPDGTIPDVPAIVTQHGPR